MTPQELILELLSKAESNLIQAKQALVRRDFERFNTRMLDTQDIFCELRLTANGAGGRYQEADRFFVTVLDFLAAANINEDETLLDDLFLITRRLRIIYTQSR